MAGRPRGTDRALDTLPVVTSTQCPMLTEAAYEYLHDSRWHGDLLQGLGFDQPGVEPSEATIANWWRQGMMGGAKGQYECVFAFIREAYSGDPKKIRVR